MGWRCQNRLFESPAWTGKLREHGVYHFMEWPPESSA
jgi:hypothetical protein